MNTPFSFRINSSSSPSTISSTARTRAVTTAFEMRGKSGKLSTQALQARKIQVKKPGSATNASLGVSLEEAETPSARSCVQRFSIQLPQRNKATTQHQHQSNTSKQETSPSITQRRWVFFQMRTRNTFLYIHLGAKLQSKRFLYYTHNHILNSEYFNFLYLR